MKWHKLRFIAYDTICTISAPEDANPHIDEILEAGRDIALKIQSTLNMFDAQSELSLLCKNYSIGKTYRVSPMLLDFLKWNKVFYEATDGLFDPTVGPLIKLWDFLADEPVIPSDEQIREKLSVVGFSHVNVTGQFVSFDREGIVIDPGASGKGYALKLVAEYLRENGVSTALLDFGGNIYVIGGKNKERAPWKIALVDPDNVEDYKGTVFLRDAGIATSSWYEHSFSKDGRIFHHLIDPRTGYPKPLNLKSVSVISTDGAFTDFLSTSIFILGEEKGIMLIENMRKRYDEKIDCVIVREDGSVRCTGEGIFCSHR